MRVSITTVLTGPHAVDGEGQLRADLTALGCVIVETDGPAAAARVVASASTTGRVALVDRRFVGHQHALRLMLADTRWSAIHGPGVLIVSGPARDALAELLRAVPDLTGHHIEGNSPAAKLTARRPLVPDDIAAELAHDISVHELAIPKELIAELIEQPLAARKAGYEAVAAINDEQIRTRKVVEPDDGLFTTLFVSSYSRYLAPWFARRAVSPKTVAFLSLGTALVAAIIAATGSYAGYIAAATALYGSFVLDRVSEQLARYTLNFSYVNAWLNTTFGHLKEYAVYAGLATGSARNGDNVWLLACIALALQTLRQHIGSPSTAKTQPKSLRYWLHQTIILPAGEHWALIAILMVLITPRTTFTVLLIWITIAVIESVRFRVRPITPASEPEN